MSIIFAFNLYLSLDKTIMQQITDIFSNFFQITGFDNSCEMICMKYQSLFSGKNIKVDNLHEMLVCFLGKIRKVVKETICKKCQSLFS